MNTAVFRVIGKFLKRNSKKIFTITNLLGIPITAVLATEAGYKTCETVREMKLNADGKDIPKMEYIKKCAPHFIPTVLSVGVTVGSGVAASAQWANENAALAAVASASDTALRELRDAVKEKYGAKKADELEQSVAQKVVEAHPVQNYIVVDTGFGTELCYDTYADRYFYCSREHIVKVFNDMNARILREMYVTFNEVYGEIGLKPAELGRNVGWNVDHMIDADLTWVDNDGRPMLVVDHYERPVTVNNESI